MKWPVISSLHETEVKTCPELSNELVERQKILRVYDTQAYAPTTKYTTLVFKYPTTYKFLHTVMFSLLLLQLLFFSNFTIDSHSPISFSML